MDCLKGLWKCVLLGCTLGFLNWNHSISDIWEPKSKSLVFCQMTFHPRSFFYPIPSPHSSFSSALGSLSRTPSLLRLSKSPYYALSQNPLLCGTYCHSSFTRTCETASWSPLSPASLPQSCRFLFTIMSPFPHLTLTHSGPSIYISE